MRVLLVPLLLFAGTYTVHPNPLTKKQSVQDSTRARSVYVEYGGPSAIYSVTYDTRLARTNNGWGVRAGVGFLPIREINNFMLPVQVNYLVGKIRHFFEVGAGATYFYGDMSSSWFGPSEEGSMVLGTLSTSYRYQPLSLGITARIGLTGLAGSFNDNALTAIPHISVGYRF